MSHFNKDSTAKIAIAFSSRNVVSLPCHFFVDFVRLIYLLQSYAMKITGLLEVM